MNLKKILNSRWTILLICIAIISIPFYLTNLGAITHDREGCERLNVTRVSYALQLRGDIKTRSETIKQDRQGLEILNAPHPIKAIKKTYGIEFNKETLKISVAQTKQRIKLNTDVIKNDKASLNHLVQSTTKYAIEKGSVQVDCSKAYPKPWPF